MQCKLLSYTCPEGVNILISVFCFLRIYKGIKIVLDFHPNLIVDFTSKQGAMSYHICDMQQGKLRPLLIPCHIPSVLLPKKNQEKFDLILNTERHYIPEIMKFKKTMFHILSPVGRSLSLSGGRKFRLAATSDRTLSPPPGLQRRLLPLSTSGPDHFSDSLFQAAPLGSHSLEAWLLPPAPTDMTRSVSVEQEEDGTIAWL